MGPLFMVVTMPQILAIHPNLVSFYVHDPFYGVYGMGSVLAAEDVDSLDGDNVTPCDFADMDDCDMVTVVCHMLMMVMLTLGTTSCTQYHLTLCLCLWYGSFNGDAFTDDAEGDFCP